MMKGRCLQSFIRTFGDADDERSVDFHCKNIDFASSTSDRLGWEAATSAPTTPIAEVIDSPSPSSCCTALFHSLCSLIRLHCGVWKEGRKKKFLKNIFPDEESRNEKTAKSESDSTKNFLYCSMNKAQKKVKLFPSASTAGLRGENICEWNLRVCKNTKKNWILRLIDSPSQPLFELCCLTQAFWNPPCQLGYANNFSNCFLMRRSQSFELIET